MSSSSENLVKVHVDLPNNWATSGESMWATDLGNNRYRLENVPFFAYGLNFHDVVIAIPVSEETIPEIRSVEQPSGNRTLRIHFEEHVGRSEQEKMLDALKKFQSSYERATSHSISIDVDADGDYLGTFDYFEGLEKRGLLGFETCEVREEGSFDEKPED